MEVGIQELVLIQAVNVSIFQHDLCIQYDIPVDFADSKFFLGQGSSSEFAIRLRTLSSVILSLVFFLSREH